MKPRIGVLLSGCGVMDGSEIHEATLTLYFLEKHGAEVICLAPDKDQLDVVDHISGAPVSGKRNVLREAARIARGKIRDVAGVAADELDGIIVPGGFGAAKNLSTFAVDGSACTVDPGAAALLKDLHANRKPIGALCIAPAVIAALLGGYKVTVTIGTDPGTAAALEKMGAVHCPAGPEEIVVDAVNRVISTPCYMTAKSIQEVGAGAEKVALKVIEFARAQAGAATA
jgi:enhancing lycopene biosynthesis protein 2